MMKNVQKPGAGDPIKRKVILRMAAMLKRKRKNLLSHKKSQKSRKSPKEIYRPLILKPVEMAKDSEVVVEEIVVKGEEDVGVAQVRKKVMMQKVAKNRQIKAATIRLLERNNPVMMLMLLKTVTRNRHAPRQVSSFKIPAVLISQKEIQELLEQQKMTVMKKVKGSHIVVVEVAEEVVEEAVEAAAQVLQPAMLLTRQSKHKKDLSEDTLCPNWIRTV